METLTSKITFRPYTEEDIPGILRLWENSSDFGGLTAEQFNDWFLKTPYEKVEIIVAVDEEEQLIGLINFLPSRVYVNQRIVKAMKIAAPILDTRFRFTDPHTHPILKLFLKGVEQAKRQDFSLFYIFPARGWLRALEMYPGMNLKWQTATYETFSIGIEQSADTYLLEEGDLTFNKANSFTEEYEILWENAIINLPIRCGIVREKNWLTYRHGEHYVVEARSRTDRSLKGYLAIKKDTGLLVDMLAATTDELKKTFWGSLATLANSQTEKPLIKTGKVTGMLTDMMSDILKEYQVEFPIYKFDFGCCSLCDSLDAEHIQPNRWHMMPDV